MSDTEKVGGIGPGGCECAIAIERYCPVHGDSAAPPVDRSARVLTDGSPVTPDHREIDPTTGMQKGYVVLSAEERAKGFVRPVRDTYRHVGERPKHPLRDLTADEHEQYDQFGYVAFEAYPPDSDEAAGGSVTGNFWTAARLKSGCGTETKMGRALAETYARDPSFYSGTFCSTCRGHFPLSQFVWLDGSQVGS